MRFEEAQLRLRVYLSRKSLAIFFDAHSVQGFKKSEQDAGRRGDAPTSNYKVAKSLAILLDAHAVQRFKMPIR